jgi:hypothetical protein
VLLIELLLLRPLPYIPASCLSSSSSSSSHRLALVLGLGARRPLQLLAEPLQPNQMLRARGSLKSIPVPRVAERGAREPDAPPTLAGGSGGFSSFASPSANRQKVPDAHVRDGVPRLEPRVPCLAQPLLHL